MANGNKGKKFVQTSRPGPTEWHQRSDLKPLVIFKDADGRIRALDPKTGDYRYVRMISLASRH